MQLISAKTPKIIIAAVTTISLLNCSSKNISFEPDIIDASDYIVSKLDHITQKKVKKTKKKDDSSPAPKTHFPLPPPQKRPLSKPDKNSDDLKHSQCGDGIIGPKEQCDDGNRRSGDGCSSRCKKERCGDGIVNNIDENCDDGNSDDNDGCNKKCQSELSFYQSYRNKLEVGNSHTCFKSQNNWRLKCWGSNEQGELGQENKDSISNGVGIEIKEARTIHIGRGISTALIAAGGNNTSKFTCLVTSAGTLKCFGDNSFGQLGRGDTIAVGANKDEMGKGLSKVALGFARSVKDVDAGSQHVCVVLDNSSIQCFGRNNYGQLGLGDTNNRGDEPGEMGLALPFVNLGVALRAQHVALGQDFSCALIENGQIKCWGRNDSGQLGQSHTKTIGSTAQHMGKNLLPIDLGEGRIATQVAAGAKHVCALLDDSSLKCFGNNNFGQLGQGNTNNIGDEESEMGDKLLAINLGTHHKVLQVALGDNHSCALLDGGSLKCFGNNSFGQLGQGNTNNIVDEADE
ncbi:MAG: DUF4215 domain-containing protein, partial [Myxococcales bacterium]|nr:DUF4215 domain-containing protein [Myxococcales bacterium]